MWALQNSEWKGGLCTQWLERVRGPGLQPLILPCKGDKRCPEVRSGGRIRFGSRVVTVHPLGDGTRETEAQGQRSKGSATAPEECFRKRCFRVGMPQTGKTMKGDFQHEEEVNVLAQLASSSPLKI